MTGQLERLVDYLQMKDPLERINRNDVITYYHKLIIAEPQKAFHKTLLYIADKLKGGNQNE